MSCKREHDGAGNKSSSSSKVTLTSSEKMKREQPRPPSPTPTVCTTVTTALRPISKPRPPSPAPSTSTAVLSYKAPIRVRDLSTLIELDDQMSTVTSANPGLISPSGGDLLRLAQQVDINDWRYKQKSICDRLKYVLENDNSYYDVIFEVGNEKIKAHQLILRLASPVFDRILDDAPQAEGQPNSSQKEKVISIPEIEPATFRNLLKFVYTDKVSSKLGDRELLSLMKAAKTCGIIHLYDKCKRSLKNGISNDIAIEVYEFASFCKDKSLMDFASTHIADNAFAIFDSDPFVRLSKEDLGKLLDRDDLNIDELSVFLNVVRWAQAKCKDRNIPESSTNLRKVADDIIYKVRFPLMLAEQVVFQVTRTNILNSDELLKILNYLCVPEPEKRKEVLPIPFNTTPRKSRKNMVLDYGKSPGRSSSVITECIEITSSSSDEPDESETASCVSSNSTESNKKNRKRLKRAHSTSSKESKRRKREQDQLKDLFGDESPVSREIALVNKQICLNDYIDEIRTYNNLDEVEEIVFENVKILDFKSLESKKVYFPTLRNFKMNIKTDEPTKSLLTSEDFHLERLLFFSTGRDRDWLYQDVYKTGVNITLIINKVIVLKVSHITGHVTLNKFNGAQSILKSLRQDGIKSLVYSHVDFYEKYFPPTLCRLVLLSSISDNVKAMNEFLRRFGHLKELTIFPPVSGGSACATVPLVFDERFKAKNKLKICGLRGFKLSIHSSLTLKNMTALYLWKTGWDKTFEDRFHHIFPNLKEVFFIMMKGSPFLLKNMLKVSSLKVIISWCIDWELQDQDVSDICHRYKAPVSRSERSFCLKKQEDGSWEYEKLNYEGFNENIYQKFQYEFLYQDYATFKNCS